MNDGIKICDADARVALGDAYSKFAAARGQMSGGDASEPRFGIGRDGLRGLIRYFDSYANDPHSSASDREQCARARDIIAGTLAGLESAAR